METASPKAKNTGSGRRFFLWMLAVVGAFVILGAIVAIVGIIALSVEGRIPGKTILEVDFEKAFIEYVPDDPIAKAVLGSNVIVRDVVDALEKAAEDDRVVALVGRIGNSGVGMAHVQEIRDAIIAFRSSGKPAIAFSETFGEFAAGNVSYYLATAFDEIYLQPSGDLGLTGIMYESFFLKGTLDKLGLVPRGDRRQEYKSAFNQFTEEKYTIYHREATQKVMDSQFGQIVKGIAEARALSELEVRQLIDGGPFLAQEAVDAKLIDVLAYRDEVYEKVREDAGEGAKFLYLSKYLNRVGRLHNKGTKVALIYGVGSIMRGKSGFDPLYLEPSMGSETIARAFRDAIKDKNVKAILFRIDSPGGSYIASDTIWREVLRAKEAGKPVIVSMGNVAGSGGYYVAMPADKIVAQPATITGSIGVLSLKMLTNGIWEKVGVTWDELHTSENATVWSSTHDFTPEQWDRFQDWLDVIYDEFTSKVARGRNLDKEKVLEIAKGRIWSGEDAKELGLVDELGGFPTAMRLVREELDLVEDAPIKLTLFPKEKSIFEIILREKEESSETNAAVNVMIHTLEMMQPVTRMLKEIGVGAEQGVLTIPEINRIW